MLAVRRGFRDARPTYQALDGLRFKAFSSIDKPNGTYFGGIYLWTSEQQARHWFSPAWFADVGKKRHTKPLVEYLPVVRMATFVPATFDYRQHESDCVTVFVHDPNPDGTKACQTAHTGLLRTYLVEEVAHRQGALLLFTSATAANAFLTQHDWFKTPVLLSNEPVVSQNH